MLVQMRRNTSQQSSAYDGRTHLYGVQWRICEHKSQNALPLSGRNIESRSTACHTPLQSYTLLPPRPVTTQPALMASASIISQSITDMMRRLILHGKDAQDLDHSISSNPHAIATPTNAPNNGRPWELSYLRPSFHASMHEPPGATNATHILKSG